VDKIRTIYKIIEIFMLNKISVLKNKKNIKNKGGSDM